MRLIAVLVIGTLLTPPVHVADAKDKGGTVHIGQFARPRTLQPVLVSDVLSAEVTERLYDSLIEVDPSSGLPVAHLATWTVSADGLHYDLEIRRQAQWSDGRPIVADDWLTTVKAVARSRTTIRRANFAEIEGFDAYASGAATSISGIETDGRRLQVRTRRAFCPGLLAMFTIPLIPAHVFAKYTQDDDPSKNLDAAPENLAPPVTSGPFLFGAWLDDRIVLERNHQYWQGKPLLDGVTFEVIVPSVVPSRLADGTLTFAAVTPQQLAALETQPGLRVSRFPSLGYTFIGWNVRSVGAPALADRRVREALAYGLDTEGFIADVLRGEATQTVTHHPPFSWAYPSGLNAYPFDPARARALIEDAGYIVGPEGYYERDGVTLGFTLVTNPGNALREALLGKARDDYGAIGVRVTPLTAPFGTLVERLTSGSPEIEAWILGWALGPEPDPFGIWHSSQIPDPIAGRRGFNSGGFTAPGLDEAIEAARSGNCSISARKAHYDTFNRILNEEQPYNFGFVPNQLVVRQANLRGFDPGTFGLWRGVHLWVIDTPKN